MKGILLIFFTLFLAFEGMYPQETERAHWLPQHWRLHQNLHDLSEEMETTQGMLKKLGKTHQELSQLLFALPQSADELQLSMVNKNLSLNLSFFLKELEQLSPYYEQLSQNHQKLKPFLTQLTKKIVEGGEKSEQTLKSLKQECLFLQEQKVYLLQRYRQAEAQETRQKLRDFFALSEEQLQHKTQLWQKYQKHAQNLQQLQQQFENVFLIFQQIDQALQAQLKLLQEERQYIFDFAGFQIDLLRSSTFLKKIQQSQEDFQMVETQLYQQIESYSHTRDQLEEKISETQDRLLKNDLFQEKNKNQTDQPVSLTIPE